MNNYDKYYRKGGDYVIPVEIFNDLLGEVEELHNKIDKAIDFINSQSPDAGVSGHRIKEILKDSDVDE